MIQKNTIGLESLWGSAPSPSSEIPHPDTVSFAMRSVPDILGAIPVRKPVPGDNRARLLASAAIFVGARVQPGRFACEVGGRLPEFMAEMKAPGFVARR
jgi:hypothetical protein